MTSPSPWPWPGIGPREAAAWTLRTRSRSAIRLMTELASGHDPLWRAEAGRVLALLPEPDLPGAAAALGTVPPQMLTADLAGVLLQCLVVTGDREGAGRLLDGRHDLSPDVTWAARCDLARGDQDLPAPGWTTLLSERVAEAADEVVVEPMDGAAPFTGLRAVTGSLNGGGLVTVVMTAYQPEPADLRMAVRSVLDQTWVDLELLVVDDASPRGPVADLLDDIDDARLRVIRLPDNGGTYLARNHAIDLARGTWVTFHDSDDFAHPRRLERQLAAVRDAPGARASRSRAARAWSDLRLTYPGYPPTRVNASSLLARRDDLQRLGGFDRVRKSADIELADRMRALDPRSLVDMPPSDVLAITQLRSGSLSRADVSAGWLHWSRLAYRDSYRLWHEQLRAGAPATPPDGRTASRTTPNVARPSSWRTTEPRPTATARTVGLIADLRSGTSHLRTTCALLRSLADAGHEVLLTHLEDPTVPSGRHVPVADPYLWLVQQGAATLTGLDQAVRVDLALVLDPSAVLMRDEDRAAWQVDQAVLVDLGEHPAELLGEASRTAGQLLGTTVRTLGRPQWSPSRPFPRPPRRGLRRPLVGHHLPATSRWWGTGPTDLRSLWRADDRLVQVRLAEVPEPLPGRARPAGWLVGTRGPGPEGVLTELDLMVLAPTPSVSSEEIRGVAQEAVAEGALVLLDKEPAKALTDLAPLTSLAEALQLWGDPAGWTQRVALARSGLPAPEASWLEDLVAGLPQRSSSTER